MADVNEVEVVVAHSERTTLRVGDMFLKIDADQARTDVEAEATAMAPIPTPRVLWRKPHVLAISAVPGMALGVLGEPSPASPGAWAAVPDRPGAWLMAVAKRRAIDHLRRRVVLERKQELLGRGLELDQGSAEDEIVASIDDDIGDDLLRLIFIACHPVLSTDARVALTLRLLGGLTTEEIARAFLVPEPTVAQRIVRAKRTLSEARVPFELPHGAESILRVQRKRTGLRQRSRARRLTFATGSDFVRGIRVSGLLGCARPNACMAGSGSEMRVIRSESELRQPVSA
jgi:RNA polymerase sigma factor (sigma-70 family)